MKKAFIRRRGQQVPVICQLIYHFFKSMFPVPLQKKNNTKCHSERAPVNYSQLQRAKRQFKEEYYSRNVLATAPLLLKLKEGLISKEQTRFLFTRMQNKLKFILHQILLHVKGQLQLLKYGEIQGRGLSKSHRTTGSFLRGILTLRNGRASRTSVLQLSIQPPV